jgi:glutamate-1-semialdehyde 2,1-aminomutase
LKTANVGMIKSALNACMLLNGVDMFSNGGLLSAAHSDEDIDRTIEAFDTTIRRMRDEGIVG